MEKKTRTEEVYDDEIIVVRGRLYIVMLASFTLGLFTLKLAQSLFGV